jgi:hypothetical protein
MDNVAAPAATGWLRARIPAIAVISGVVTAVILIIVSSLGYPAIFRLSGAAVLLALTVVMLLGYTACGLWALRRPAATFQTGLVWGAVAGVMWSTEIWVGGPARLGYSAEQALGGTFEVLALVATVTAGVLAGVRTGRPGAAWRAGLFSGVVSGVIVYVFAVIMTLVTLPVLASRSDYQAQFAHSHAPSMNVYLVGDILGAVAAHLVINLVLGLVGGALGALSARATPLPWGSGREPA